MQYLGPANKEKGHESIVISTNLTGIPLCNQCPSPAETQL